MVFMSIVATLHLLRCGLDLLLLLLLLLLPLDQKEDDDENDDDDDNADDDTSYGTALELLLSLDLCLAASAFARNELDEVHRGARVVSMMGF